MNPEAFALIAELTPDSKRQGSPLERGKIISPPPDAKIDVRGLILEKDQVIFNSFLLKNYRRAVDVDGGDNGLLKNYLLITKNEIKAGDEVVVMPFADKQMWYVFDVISLPNDEKPAAEGYVKYAERESKPSVTRDVLPPQENNIKG